MVPTDSYKYIPVAHSQYPGIDLLRFSTIVLKWPTQTPSAATMSQTEILSKLHFINPCNQVSYFSAENSC